MWEGLGGRGGDEMIKIYCIEFSTLLLDYNFSS